MTTRRSIRVRPLGLALGLLAASLSPLLLGGKSEAAAALSKAQVRFDRMQTSTPTTGTVCAQPGTTSVDVKTWAVTFPTGYTVSATAANWQTANISTSNLAWPTGAVAWPNATSATATISGQTVTWTNTAAQSMNNTTIYCYNWTAPAAVSTASSANGSLPGSITTNNSSATAIDTASYSTATVTNDQIAVTATIPQAFTFALSGNSDPLGTLSSSVVTPSPTPQTATVNTNSKSGWQVWAKDASAGLNSPTASKTVASNCTASAGANSTLAAGTEGYNTGVTYAQTSGGTVTVAPIFVGGVLGKGGGLCTNLQSLISSAGVANNAVITLTNNAAINATTAAATDYTDTITVVGAGLF